jgi:hypothetical protein
MRTLHMGSYYLCSYRSERGVKRELLERWDVAKQGKRVLLADNEHLLPMRDVPLDIPIRK